MGARDKKAIFAYISTMARQVCAVSEQAEKTGTLGGLDFVLLQSLGYAIVQHVALIDQPRGAAPASEPLVPSEVAMVVEEEEERSVPRSVDFKTNTAGKRKLNHESSTTSSVPKRKKSKEETPATAHASRPSISTPSPTNNAATTNSDEPAKQCLDCGRTKTNQWRSGPKGMSTLCNACGMRYTRRLKRQVIPMTASNTSTTNSHLIRRGSGILDSPLCGHESDHGLSPVSSPLPFPHSSPMFDDSLGAGQQQEKRSNLYTLLN